MKIKGLCVDFEC